MLFQTAVRQEVKDDLVSVADNVLDGNGNLSDLEDALKDYASTISGSVNGVTDINKYIESVTKSDLFQQTVKSTADSGMTLVLEADGNNLVYKYTYTVPVADNAAELVNQSLQSNASTFKVSADTIRMEAPCVEKVI